MVRTIFKTLLVSSFVSRYIERCSNFKLIAKILRKILCLS